MGRLARGLARGLAILGVLAVAAIAGGPARAQMESREAIQLQNEMLELRRDMQGLREQIGRIGSGGGGSSLGFQRPSAPVTSGDLTAALLARVSQLEEQVRRMQGRLDEVDNVRQRQGEDLRKELEDLNFKLGLGAGAAAGGTATTSPPPRPLGNVPDTPQAAAKPPAAAPPAAARRTPELAMQQGNAALARRDYAAAEVAAREVLAFPRSPRALDGQLLLAQALAGKRDHAAAAVAFDDAYNRSRKGSNAQPALLGLANSLTAIDEKRAACETLNKLRAEFSSPRADLREAIAAARKRAGCR